MGEVGPFSFSRGGFVNDVFKSNVSTGKFHYICSGSKRCGQPHTETLQQDPLVLGRLTDAIRSITRAPDQTETQPRLLQCRFDRVSPGPG
jgi:hypothetical protein